MAAARSADPNAMSRRLLEAARLYLVTDLDPPSRPLAGLVEQALAGGVDAVQLRDKSAPAAEIVAAARALRGLCDRHGALLIVNDRPDLALAAGADGVHVGQEDMPVAEVRRELGPELLVGLSTHSQEQLDAGLASEADYLSAGPVHATPTKPGRPAVGTELVRYAASRRPGKPWFAIGGIDPGNAGEIGRAHV